MPNQDRASRAHREAPRTTVRSGVAIQLVVSVIVGLALEGLVLHDPWVELGNGYNLGAISWNSPCHLVYWAWQDSRPPSDWSYEPGGQSSVWNDVTGEQRDFAGENEWKAAIRSLDARPASARVLLDAVAAFDWDESHAIGRGNDGFFLLDKDNDSLETWATEEPWARAVRTRTQLDPDRLRNPKAWTLQYRDGAYWAIMGTYTAAVLVWIAVPLIRAPKDAASTANSA